MEQNILISNTTEITKKDFQNVAKYRKFTPTNIVVFVITFLFGIELICKYSPYLFHHLRGDYVLNTRSIIIAVTYVLFGIFFMIWGFIWMRIRYAFYFKRNRYSLMRTYNFTDEGIESVINTKALDEQCKFRYGAMDGYFQKDDAIYVRVLFGRQKMFLIIHDDGYTVGSKEEAISILEKNNIRELK